MTPRIAAPPARPPTLADRASHFVLFKTVLASLVTVAIAGMGLTVRAYRKLDTLDTLDRRVGRLERRDSIDVAHNLFQTCVAAAQIDGLDPRACSALRPRGP